MDDIKKMAEMLRQSKQDKAQMQQQMEKERQNLIATVGDGIVNALRPVLERLAENSRMTRDDFERAVANIKVTTETPQVTVPPIKVPTPQVTVNPPQIRIPDIKMPDEMGVRGWVNMMMNDEPITMANPLPVTLRNADGSPMDMMGGTSVIGGGGGGGKHDFFTIKDIRASSASLIDQTEGALKVTGDLSATLTADTGSGEIGSNTLRVVQATDAVASVNIVSGAASGTQYANGDTALTPTGTVAMGSTGEESGNLYALATGGGVTGSTVLRVVHATDVAMSVSVSGAISSTGSYLLDGDGNYRGTVPVEGTVVVSSVTASTASALVDSTGVQYSGSNPLPVTATVSGSITSTVIEGTAVSDAADDGSAPVKTGGIARTANPTAVANGDRVSATYDDLGRQLVRPVQVRDLITTAYVSLTDSSEDTLLAGSASTFRDLIYVMGANESDAAVSVDFRCGTGGSVVLSLQIPANSTAGITTPVPLPMTEAAQAWTAQNPASDISNTTINITALFSNEV